MAGHVTLRRASEGDEELLVRLRVDFLSAMCQVAPETVLPLEEHLRAYVGPAIRSGGLVAWLAEAGDCGVVANGWITLIQKAPHVRNLSGLEGFIVNIHTLPAWREQGLATAIVEHLLASARDAGAGLVKLMASPDGRRVYQRLGFVPDEGSMRLRL